MLILDKPYYVDTGTTPTQAYQIDLQSLWMEFHKIVQLHLIHGHPQEGDQTYQKQYSK